MDWMSALGGLAGGSNETSSGVNSSGGQFGNVTFGSTGGGFSVDKETMLYIAGAAVLVYLISKA